jgi:hypothetical protein
VSSGEAAVSAGAPFAVGVAFVCFWNSLTAAVRVVLAADGVACEADAAFVLCATPSVATPRAGADPVEAACASLVVPAVGAGAPTALTLAGGSLVADGGVSGA